MVDAKPMKERNTRTVTIRVTQKMLDDAEEIANQYTGIGHISRGRVLYIAIQKGILLLRENGMTRSPRV